MDTFVPTHPLLRRHIDSIYVFNKHDPPVRYFSYPSLNVALGLFQDASLSFSDQKISVQRGVATNTFGLACKRLTGVLEVRYLQMVNEIAINFKPLGFISFCKIGFGPKDVFPFPSWDPSLNGLFALVFQGTTYKDNWEQEIENFLLRQYTEHQDEKMLLRAIDLLEDQESFLPLNDIAALVGVHYKYLYRSFKKNIGCSPAHFRKVAQFRNSLMASAQKTNRASLTEISYSHHYFDQAHFIKHMRRLSGLRPSNIRKELTLMAAGKIIWKFL